MSIALTTDTAPGYGFNHPWRPNSQPRTCRYVSPGSRGTNAAHLPIMTTPPKFAVQAATFSEAIHVGRISNGAFAEKEEATDMTLFAVAQYVQQNFGGGMQTEFPKAGLRLKVTVEEIA
jgi:hypothetical protein